MQVEFRISKGSPLHNVWRYHKGRRFVRFHGTEFRWNPKEGQYIAVEPYGDVEALSRSKQVESEVFGAPVGEVKVKTEAPMKEEVLEEEKPKPKTARKRSRKSSTKKS